MNSYTIKVITKSNVNKNKRLIKLYKSNIEECFKISDLDNKVYVSDALFSSLEIFALLNKDKSIAASCILEYNKKYNTCEIHEVCVNIKYQGQGLCGQLLQSALLYLGDRHVFHAQIYCMDKNKPALKCYSKLFTDHHKVLGIYHSFVKFL